MKSCLIVDDSAVVRKVAKRILEGFKLAVAEAEDGPRGLAACEARMPDVVIVDALMPAMDGFEAVRALRRMPDGGRPRIMIGVVESDLATIARVLQAGADTYLMKPFTPELLRGKLEELGLLEPPAAARAA